MCDEWKDNYLSFKEWALNNGYAENLTIDRIDVNGNYEPSNCRWATIKEQANNRRSNTLLKFHGETKTISQWADTIGIPQKTIKGRLSHGWDVERTLTTPIRSI